MLTLYTNGTDVLRISKYVPPTDSIQGYFILARDGKGCNVTLQNFLKDWKRFNSDAAFADYLLYTDEHLKNDTSKITRQDEAHRHMMMWTKGRCLEIGKLLATPVNFNDLMEYF